MQFNCIFREGARRRTRLTGTALPRGSFCSSWRVLPRDRFPKRSASLGGECDERIGGPTKITFSVSFTLDFVTSRCDVRETIRAVSVIEKASFSSLAESQKDSVSFQRSYIVPGLILGSGSRNARRPNKNISDTNPAKRQRYLASVFQFVSGNASASRPYPLLVVRK